MSYTTVKGVWPGIRVEDVEELRNSFGTAPVIWNQIAMKYLGCEDHAYLQKRDLIWPLYKHLGIPAHQRAVLLMTYDRAYVLKRDYDRAATDIQKWLEDFPPSNSGANHWPRIAEIFKFNPDIPAIGLYCTSVSEYPFQGEWNEEKGDYAPIDWSDCFSVYDKLDETSGGRLENERSTKITT